MNAEEKFSSVLRDYKVRKKEALVFDRKDEEVEFFDHCLECIEPYERDLIEKILIEKLSIRGYARKTGFSRNFIAKERDRLIGLMTQFFRVKYF